MSIDQEIRDAIERNKAIREEVGQMNCELSKLEHKCEQYMKAADEGYRKGYEDGKDSVVNGCDGCRYKSKHESGRHPCFACARYYKDDYYEPIQKDEITVGVHFGDEIVVNGERGVVVSHENEGCTTIWALLNGYRTPQIVHKNNYTKTGRRFGIEEIMEAMRK